MALGEGYSAGAELTVLSSATAAAMASTSAESASMAEASPSRAVARAARHCSTCSAMAARDRSISTSWGCIGVEDPNANPRGENFPSSPVLSMNVPRFLLILALLAAAVPAAARAQDPVPVTPPVATTGAAEAITQTGATLTGTIDRNGGATTYHFEYGTSAAYGLNTTETPVPEEGTDPVTVKVPITGLTRDTAYSYRLVATNPAGISRGANRTFRTAPGPRPPGVSRTTARDITSRDARMISTVDPNGLETTVRIEYGRSTSYGAASARVSAGAGDRGVPISVPISRLRPYTRYHYRAVATNSVGTTRSLDRSFVTQREPTGISIALTPSRVLWSGSLSVIGRVGGTSVGGTRVALEKQDWPFSAGFGQVGDMRRVSSSGSFRFDLPAIFVTSQFRVVTRSGRALASTIRTASSAVKVGARAQGAGAKRSRVLGTIWPRVPNGRVSLQKRSPKGKWVVVRRRAVRSLDANRSRYRFTVKRKKRVGRYRVVVLARDGGAHVPGRSREVRVRARRAAKRSG